MGCDRWQFVMGVFSPCGEGVAQWQSGFKCLCGGSIAPPTHSPVFPNVAIDMTILDTFMFKLTRCMV